MSPEQKEISLNRTSRWSRPFLIFHPPGKSASSILLSRFFLHIGCRYGVSPQISFFNGMKVSYNWNNHRSSDSLLKSLFWQISIVKGWSDSSEIVCEVTSCWILQSVISCVPSLYEYVYSCNMIFFFVAFRAECKLIRSKTKANMMQCSSKKKCNNFSKQEKIRWAGSILCRCGTNSLEKMA